MIPNLPIYISLLFILTTLATLLLFNNIVRKSVPIWVQNKAWLILIIQVAWLVIQALVTFKGAYNSNLDALPPKLLVLAILPPLIVIFLLFITKAGRNLIDNFPLKQILLLNIVRVPVEIVLFCLYLNGAVPGLMTFEGGNLDIFSGLTAPIIIYYGFRSPMINKNLILVWNFICLGLLVNIVVRAVLSAPLPIQKLAFDHPNIAILNFPFIWLPAFVVPIVLFGHLLSIRKLLRMNS